MARQRLATGDPAFFAKKADEAVQAAETETKIDAARGFVFDRANGARRHEPDSRLPPLVERTFRPRDWIRTVERFEEWRSSFKHRTDEAFVRKAHADGPEILDDLHAAFIQVREAREVWELENDAFFGTMRQQATDVLQDEKDRKVRTKQITEADVDHRCASMFPDAWPKQEAERLRMKLTEDRVKSCIEVALVCCRVLETMVAKLR